MKPAVFLDRDGTLIESVPYLATPEQVRLLPGAAEAVRRFSDAGFLVVLASNQSGVARGFFDEAALSRVHKRLVEVLSAEGASLDGAYYCPYLDGPEACVEIYRLDSELRKPRPGMLFQAAKELDIDLEASWMLGDSPCDAEAGQRAGCRTIHVLGSDAGEESEPTVAECTVDNILAAVPVVTQPMTEDREEHSTTDRHAELPDSASNEADESADGNVVDLLKDIRDRIDRAQRQDTQQDFSVLRLFGTLLQMFAIMVAMWGLIAIFDDRAQVATARLTLACFFQLASMTAIAVERFR